MLVDTMLKQEGTANCDAKEGEKKDNGNGDDNLQPADTTMEIELNETAPGDQLETAHDGSYPVGSNVESPPVVEDGRWVEAAEQDEDRKRRPTEPKPEDVVEHSDALEVRTRQIDLQQAREAESKQVI